MSLPVLGHADVTETGGVLFKKRKPDEPSADAGPADAVEIVDPAQSGFRQPSSPLRVPARPVDSGLGVPPYRPVSPPKEQPAMAMGRPPNQPPAPPNPTAPLPRPIGGPRPSREPAERRTLVVGRGISVQGTVQDAERLVVEGTVEASMITATELAISPGGVFKGEVEVEDAEIAGTIDGTLTVRGNLVVRSTGRLLGTARCRRLQVEDGGQITGRMEMITADAKPEKAPAAVED